MAFTTVVTHVVGLATGFDICVHSRCRWHIGAMEIGVWYFVEDGKVDARMSGNFTEILTLGLAGFRWLNVELSSWLFVVLVVFFVVDRSVGLL